jgi:hypothetical protein
MSDRITKGTVLKTWMGRDDGYPQRKFHAHPSLEAAVRNTIKTEQFFRLVPIPKEEVSRARAEIERKGRAREKASLGDQIRRLKAKRDRL